MVLAPICDTFVTPHYVEGYLWQVLENKLPSCLSEVPPKHPLVTVKCPKNR